MFKEASHRDSDFEYFDDHIADEDGIKHSIKCLDFHMMISEEYLVCCTSSSNGQKSMLSRASSLMMNRNNFKNHTAASKILS